MGSSTENNSVYCCVSKVNKILYSYNSGSHEFEALASLCLENAPPFHAWYFHTIGRRTFGFLIEDGYTYLAIVDSSLGSLEILQFLQNIRDGFKKVVKNRFKEELVPIIRGLISSLESVSWPSISADQKADGTPSNDGPMLTKAPLLGKTSSKHDKKKKKMKDRAVEVRDVTEDQMARGLKIDMPPEPMADISLQKSSSPTGVRGQQIARRLWCRHVKIVIAIDVLLCLVLFGIWLAVCRGFQCVSSR